MSDPAVDLPKGSEEAPKEEPSKKPSKKKLIFLLGGVGIFLIGAFAGTAVYLGWIEIPGLSFSNKTAQAAPKPVIDVGPMVKLSPLIINLNESSSRHYLKMTLVLEIGKKDWVEDVQGRIPSLTDMVIVTLGDKRIEDLRKTEARENVKKELLQKANLILAGEKIRRIYFDEFLFQ
jgi:flagellar basal body-associated protein FliL